MTVYAINTNTLQCRPFASEEEMRSSGNIWHGFKSAEDLESKMVGLGLTITKMATIYNKASEKEVKKFADKKTAAKRVFNVISDQVVTIDEIIKKPKTPQIDPLPGMTPLGLTPAPKVSKGKGAFYGKTVKVLVNENPRKSGTRAYNIFEIMLEHKEISYESLLDKANYSKAAVREDVAHDLKKGRVELVD